MHKQIKEQSKCVGKRANNLTKTISHFTQHFSLSCVYTITNWLSVRSACGDTLTFVDTRLCVEGR